MNAPELGTLFWAKVDKSGDCWKWTGAQGRGGYGLCTIGRRNYSVHRIAFAGLVRPLAPGEYIDHMCHTTLCVNPEHLQAVTNRQNVENRAGANSNNRSSGVRGVTWDKARGKWKVLVKSNYQLHNGGRFDSIVEAESAAIELRNRLMTNNLTDRRAS